MPSYLYEDSASEEKRRNLATCRKGEFEGMPEKVKDPEWSPDYCDKEHPAPHPIGGVVAIGARIPVPVGTIHAFDGAADTHSWGCCTDFNLMLRKGCASGGMLRITASAGSEYAVEVSENHIALLYCVQGDVQIAGTDAAFAAGDSLLTDAPVRLLLRADSVLMEATASR